jgi:hypothetical protein
VLIVLKGEQLQGNNFISLEFPSQHYRLSTFKMFPWSKQWASKSTGL